MRYLVLVSHGTFAQGLHSVLKMLAGDREEVLSCSLKDGEGADEYVAELKQTISVIGEGDSVFLFGDIIGGSPLTNAINAITEAGLLPRTRIFGGVNLPAVLTAALSPEADDDSLAADVVSEGVAALQEFKVAVEDDDEDDL